MKAEPPAVESYTSTQGSVTTKGKATWEALRQHPLFAQGIAEGWIFLASEYLKKLSDQPA